MIDKKRASPVLASFARLISILHALPFRTMPVPVRMRPRLPPVLPDRAAADVVEMLRARVADSLAMPRMAVHGLSVPENGDVGYRGIGASASGGGSEVVASRGRSLDALGNAVEQVSRLETGLGQPLLAQSIQFPVLPSEIENRRASSLSMQSSPAGASVLQRLFAPPGRARSAGRGVLSDRKVVRAASASAGLPWLGCLMPNGSMPVIGSTGGGSSRRQSTSLPAVDISAALGGDDLTVGGWASGSVSGFGDALLPGLPAAAALALPLVGAIGGRNDPAVSYVPPPSLDGGRNAMPDQQTTGRPPAPMLAWTRSTGPTPPGARAGVGREMAGGETNIQMAGNVMMNGRQVGRASAGAMFRDASLPLSMQSRPNIRNMSVYTGMRIPQ